MRIPLNHAGTRSLEISEESLRTIHKYHLFDGLTDSDGLADGNVSEKLRLRVRTIIGSSDDNADDLLRVATDIIYNAHMKALGLRRLVETYREWEKKHHPENNKGNEANRPGNTKNR